MRRSGIDNPNQELSFVHIRILIRRLAPTVLVTLIFFSLSLTTIISFLPIDRETFPQIRSTYSSIVQSKFLRFSTNSSILSYLENNKQTAMLATERFDSKRQELLDAASAGIQLTKVDFSNMNLEEFPLQLLLPFEESLEFLNFGGNKLSTLPDELAQFRNLKILFFAGNNFETVPRVLGELPSLYMLSFKGNKLRSIPEESLPAAISWLILTDNQLSDLPKSVGGLKGLRKLMLTGNMFETVPFCIRTCQELQLLRISLNRLQYLPLWLLEMPRLAWLAFSGNPCFRTGISSDVSRHENSLLPIVNIEELTVGDKLGEGASSVVYKVKRNTDGAERALKLYKGAITSDGKAEDEIYAISVLGQHPQLLSPEAIVAGHSSGNTGILLPLIRTETESEYLAMSAKAPQSDEAQSSSPLYRILGYPPSFTSITRDTYPSKHLASFSQPWDLSFVLHTLLDIADVAMHIHERGVMHGDLYAHNILVKDDMVDGAQPAVAAAGAGAAVSRHDLRHHAILTDFGAATLIRDAIVKRTDEETHTIIEDVPSKQLQELFEQMEVRAFAHLLDDLVTQFTILLSSKDSGTTPILPSRYATIIESLNSIKEAIVSGARNMEQQISTGDAGPTSLAFQDIKSKLLELISYL